jgi:sugar O-acyltransferase (sialic acid O-acetyltransferase NeuD family)
VPDERGVVIVGDSAFAQIAYEYFVYDAGRDVVAFSVESSFRKRDELFGKPIVPFENLERVFSPNTHDVFVAITYTGLNRLRRRLFDETRRKGYRFATYVSSRAFVWRNVTIGENCFVFEGNVVQPFVTLGDNVILWSGNHIGHHSSIAAHCFISSHVVVSGYVEIGESCFLGVNTTIANNVRIARDCWLGPGVVITKDTDEAQIYRLPPTEAAKISSRRFFRVE